jgi:hypothetical protein
MTRERDFRVRVIRPGWAPASREIPREPPTTTRHPGDYELLCYRGELVEVGADMGDGKILVRAVSPRTGSRPRIVKRKDCTVPDHIASPLSSTKCPGCPAPPNGSAPGRRS